MNKEIKTPSTKMRDSRYELIRIVAMCFILLWHFFGKVMIADGVTSFYRISIPFLIYGVNLFFYDFGVVWNQFIN